MSCNALKQKRISDGDKILIMKPSSLGDIIHTIPVVQAIKRRCPSSHISWFVLKEYEGLVAALDDVDETIAFFRHGLESSPVYYLKTQLNTVKRLRKYRFDWVLDFQGLFRSGLFGYLSGASKRFGFTWKNEPNRLFYNFYVEVNPEKHALDRNIELAKNLGIEVTDKDLTARFRLAKPESLTLEAEDFVVFCPGGRWKSKRWPVENFVKLARRLVGNPGVRVVVVGSKDESALGEEISRVAKNGIVNLAGNITLEQLPYVLSKAKVVITNDSGPMHLAAAMGSKVFALFGPTDPSKTGPYGSGHKVFTSDVDCRPCFKRECDRNLECLRSISVEMVATELAKELGR